MIVMNFLDANGHLAVLVLYLCTEFFGQIKLNGAPEQHRDMRAVWPLIGDGGSLHHSTQELEKFRCELEDHPP